MKFSDIQLPSNKKFGAFFSLIFFSIALYLSFTGKNYISIILTILGILFIVIIFTKPDILLPFNKAWMRFGFLLGVIVSPIILGLLFYIIFTPTSIFMRLILRDELSLKRKNVNSYWKLKNLEDLENNSFNNQF